MTPDQIQALFRDAPEDEDSGIQALKPVLDDAQQLQEAKSSELRTLAEKVAIGSREGKQFPLQILTSCSLFI